MSVSTETSTELIKLYKQTKDVTIRNQIIMQYSSLIKIAALSMRNLYIKYAEVDDIINECVLTLILAVDSFDLDKNTKFETYAMIRIKGTIIDFIRKQDFIPRSVRQFSKNFESVYSSIYNEMNREPTNKEIADKMEISEIKLEKMLADSAVASTLSFEELLYEHNFDLEDGGKSTDSGLLKRELETMLAQSIDSLKSKERDVISLYYYEKLKFSDIAKILGVSESRVCQIHSKAIIKLRIALKDYLS